MAYILLTAVLILALNLYPITVSKTTVFQAKESSMLAKAEIIATSMSTLDQLTEQNAGQAVSLLSDVGIDRVVITDSYGRCVYDSAASDNVLGSYALFPEIVTALGGNDVFRCSYTKLAFESFAAIPILHQSAPSGAVYVMERDSEQAAVISSIQTNIRRLSMMIGAAVLLSAIVFSLIFSRRISKILYAIRTVREGEYSHKIQFQSRDELGQLAEEFNALTERITTTERMRRQFVSDASHELKTPLASITLLADSILQNNESMDQQTVLEFVQDIGSEAARLSRLTEKLLSLTRLDSHVEENMTPVDLAVTVDKAMRILRPLAQTRQVVLECTMDTGCVVLAREDDIYQVIFNLAENGIKYNTVGGTLRVLLYRRADQATLIVEDEGVGIPPEDMDRVFERFYRVDKARSRQAGGAGLGLAIVKDTVDKYCGTITVAARETKGTRFTVRFPLLPEGKESET